ncbi:MAG: phosphatase PAP2 family protein [Tannerella sp.]|nr:phosphatase PAP2 family protein [Tannerella sp.]
MKIFISLIIILLNIFNTTAQEVDSLQMDVGEKHSLASYIVPAALVTYGVSARFVKPVRTIDQKINNLMTNEISFKTRLDEYTEYVPAVAVYGLDLLGVKAKHNFRDRTFIMVTSHLIMEGVVQSIKHMVDVQRPNNKDNHAFPSGHTSLAFTGAQILFHEYRDASVWIPVAGYTVAAGTGILRLSNNQHWFSDIMAGAGIGILSVEASYLLLPVFHKMLGISEKDRNFVILPSVSTNYYGVGLAYSF